MRSLRLPHPHLRPGRSGWGLHRRGAVRQTERMRARRRKAQIRSRRLNVRLAQKGGEN